MNWTKSWSGAPQWPLAGHARPTKWIQVARPISARPRQFMAARSPGSQWRQWRHGGTKSLSYLEESTAGIEKSDGERCLVITNWHDILTFSAGVLWAPESLRTRDSGGREEQEQVDIKTRDPHLAARTLGHIHPDGNVYFFCQDAEMCQNAPSDGPLLMISHSARCRQWSLAVAARRPRRGMGGRSPWGGVGGRLAVKVSCWSCPFPKSCEFRRWWWWLGRGFLGGRDERGRMGPLAGREWDADKWQSFCDSWDSKRCKSSQPVPSPASSWFSMCLHCPRIEEAKEAKEKATSVDKLTHFLIFPEAWKHVAGRWFGDFQDRSGSFSFSVFHDLSCISTCTSHHQSGFDTEYFVNICQYLVTLATYCNIYWLWLPWFPTISHLQCQAIGPRTAGTGKGGGKAKAGTWSWHRHGRPWRHQWLHMLCRCAAWSHGCSLLYGTVWMSWWTG